MEKNDISIKIKKKSVFEEQELKTGNNQFGEKNCSKQHYLIFLQ